MKSNILDSNMNRLRAFGLFLSLAFILNASASEIPPPCLDSGKKLPVLNEQVHHWKNTTQNQFLARARVHGVLSKIYTEEGSHAHFQIEFDDGLDNRADDTLEVIYNLDFGKLPPLAVGMEIEACGDYITSTVSTNRYPASPDGAIIHWIHKNPRGTGHESGYLEIDGRTYGY